MDLCLPVYSRLYLYPISCARWANKKMKDLIGTPLVCTPVGITISTAACVNELDLLSLIYFVVVDIYENELICHK